MIKIDPRFYKDDAFNQDRNIECARWRDLVYVRTLKCGSEFFYRNFMQTAGWQAVQWTDIDWSNDLAFAYVMDPIQRRHKGIAEFLFINGVDDLVHKDAAFARMIAQVPCLDEHSASMRDIYGDRVRDIYWIPLSQTDHTQGQRLTDQLLIEHRHGTINWNKDFVHTTDNYLGDTYRRLRQLWDDEVMIGVARFYFQEDAEIYLRALERHGLLSQ